MKGNIRPGEIFPDYELPDHTGTRRKLSELQGNDPMILVLSRGAYCPKDRQQHRLLVELEPEIRVAYTRIVTISTDALLELSEMRLGVGAHWPFLSDPGRLIQKDLDIAEYTDPQHNPMIPHTLSLEPGLVIHSVYNGYWFWGRPSNDDLRHDLRKITQKIRPDWDLEAPGLREAWERGEKERFWPYGRPLKEVLAEAS
jgi:peroxiredoxin